MSIIRIGVTKNGIQEECKWEGVGSCPRHQIHSEKNKLTQPRISDSGLEVKTTSLSGLSYDEYLGQPESLRIGKYSRKELLDAGISESEIIAIAQTPPQNKEPEPVISTISNAGQLYSLIQEIRLQDENSVNVDEMKEKYDGIRRIDNMDDARNAFLNEQANKIYQAAWIVEADSYAKMKYSKELIEAANDIARYQNNPVGNLAVERTADGYQLSKKYDKFVNLLKSQQDEIKKEAYIKDPYYKEAPSNTLINMRAERALVEKEIEKLEKAKRNPFNLKAKNELATKRSIRQSILNDLDYYESTNSNNPRTVI